MTRNRAARRDLEDLQRPDLVGLIPLILRRDAVGERLVGEQRDRSTAERRLGEEKK